MITIAAVLLTVGVILYTLSVRESDLPEPEPVSPFRHLEERKAAIYDNLRDLQFEYRLGKLSDQDYQQTKEDLQRELAAVLAEIDRLSGQPQPAQSPKPAADGRGGAKAERLGGAAMAAASTTCPHCGARFPTPLKFCGECGKPMTREGA